MGIVKASHTSRGMERGSVGALVIDTLDDINLSLNEVSKTFSTSKGSVHTPFGQLDSLVSQMAGQVLFKEIRTWKFAINKMEHEPATLWHVLGVEAVAISSGVPTPRNVRLTQQHGCCTSSSSGFGQSCVQLRRSPRSSCNRHA